MFRRYLALFAAAALSAGCVPVTEPVGDIDKAEPNKDLIGTWRDDEREPRLWIVDRPEVKGNPKGLMRVRVVEKGKTIEEVRPKDALWFFTATVGQHTYVNLLALSHKPKKVVLEPDFARVGEYAEWAKHDQRGYWVAHIKMRGRVVTTHGGNDRAFETLMKKQKFMEIGGFYRPTPGWLTEYLDQNGPDAIFTTGKGDHTLTRLDEKK
jgi:hypothetical protein